MNTQNCVGWLLNLVGNFQPKDLEQCNLKEINDEYMSKILQYPQLQSGEAYTYNHLTQQFDAQTFYLYPNILIRSLNAGHLHLILSNCTITKEIKQYKETKAFGIILSNDIGNTYLFFTMFGQFRVWYKQMKQYCKLSGFFNKYKLADRMLPGVYQCFKKSTNAPYSVQIYKMKDFDLCPEIEEAVHNEIQLLRSIKHTNFLSLRRVYEDDQYLLIVYEYFQGESLYNLVGNSIQPLQEVQIASIIYQILQVLKFLDKHQFYHGNINPLNIIINCNNDMLQIFLMNISFKEYKINDKLEWVMNRQIDGFIAPEFYLGVPPNSQSDLYSVGVLLYFMTFPTQLPNERNFEKFDVEPHKIQQQLNQKIKLKNNNDLSPLAKKVDQNSSLSQLDLLTKLLDKNPISRINLNDAMKHHWFVNVKSKIKSQNTKKQQHNVCLPSLRTIVEMRSQSELDLKVQSQLSFKKKFIQEDPDQVPEEGHMQTQIHQLDFCQLMRKSSIKYSQKFMMS